MKRWIIVIAAAVLGSAQAAPVESWTMPNGARVVFVENHALPILDVNLNVDAGTRRDPDEKSGVAAMTCAMLSQGMVASGEDAAMNEAEISDTLADLGAEVGCTVEGDRTIVKLRTLSSDAQRDPAFRLVGRLIAQPAFPDAILSREKTRVMAGIKEADTKPGPIAEKTFWRAMYGSHPYGRRATVESVRRIGSGDLSAFHRAYYASDRLVVAIVGDATRAQAERLADQLTRRLPKAAMPLPPMDPVVLPGVRETRVAHPATQAHILIGLPAMRRADPDFFAISVGNYILGGGGFVSRLMQEVRVKRGMVYGVRSGFSPMKQEGPFQISLQTKKEQSGEAIRVVRETLEQFLKDGPTVAEMKAAKDFMIGGFALNVDTNLKLVEAASLIGYYDLPLDYLDTWKRHVAAVTAEDVRAAFHRKVDPQKMVTVIVGAPE